MLQRKRPRHVGQLIADVVRIVILWLPNPDSSKPRAHRARRTRISYPFDPTRFYFKLTRDVIGVKLSAENEIWMERLFCS